MLGARQRVGAAVDPCYGADPATLAQSPLTDPAAITRQKERAALVSVAVKVALTVAKFAAAIFSGSLALASEAGNNLGDVAVTLLSFYSIRMASKPADDEHPFGHGKVESLSALIQTGFLFALALFILIEAAKRLVSGGADVDPGPFAFGVLIVSIVVDAIRWFSLNKIAKATRSAALAADALNFLTDIVASSLALAGLVAASAGFRSGDAIAAAAVALFVGVAGFRLGRETVDTLIDAGAQRRERADPYDGRTRARDHWGRCASVAPDRRHRHRRGHGPGVAHTVHRAGRGDQG